jgi:tryptophan synthase, alpha chain (EC 4.2.1.20)
MSRIDQCFCRLCASREGALVCFVTAGDPNIDITKQVVLGLEQAGADIVELGIPFSDPIADGPSIQAASMRALQSGTSVKRVLELVRSIRAESQLPVVLMTYYNPILRYGLQRFAGEAVESGADGVIVTDLTPEESKDWKAVADAVGLNTIFLLAPTSTDSRIETVAKLSTGFIYCVSRTGVTGTRAELAQGVRELVARIRSKTEKPVVVGFGISKPEHVQDVCEYADGAVVGSLLVDLIAEKAHSDALIPELKKVVSALKSGTMREEKSALT